MQASSGVFSWMAVQVESMPKRHLWPVDKTGAMTYGVKLQILGMLANDMDTDVIADQTGVSVRRVRYMKRQKDALKKEESKCKKS